MRPTLPLLLCTGLLAGCGGGQALSPGSTEGVDPALPPPQRALIPTVDIAPATGWPQGAAPTPARGLVVSRFAGGLEHPRWLHVLPNGDVLVAESNAPAGKSGVDGIKGKVMGVVMKRAGAGVPSAERISVLRDADGDGIAEVRQPFLTGLHSPFGMALVGDTLYIANADALVSVPYRTGQLRIDAVPLKVVDLPGKGDELNHHWTKSLLASRDGARLYVGVGSNSNVAENGMAVEANRAAVLEVDPATRRVRVFASGLRNPVGLALEPQGGALWAVVNERDELGPNLVPDYLTSVREGGFYGWPYAYWGQNVDDRVRPQDPDKVAASITPDYALGSHVAALGLDFSSDVMGERFADGVFIGEHGSWNRKEPVGYKVIFVPFRDGRPAGEPIDFATGFRTDDGKTRGRPVGVTVDPRGALIVADDLANVVWRVTRSQ